MSDAQVLLGTIAGRPAAALRVGRVLDDLLLDPPADLPRPGAIFRAVIDRPMKGQGGAMLRLPDGKGFLRQTRGIGAGREHLVQVTGFAEPGKAVPVADRLLFKSRFCIVTPGAPGLNLSRSIRDDEARVRLHEIAAGLSLPEGCGLILRSAAESAESDEIVADAEAMLDAAQAVLADAGRGPELLLDGPSPAERAWIDWPVAQDAVEDTPGCFERLGIADAIDDLARPTEALPGGGSMVIEPTRALVAVDVNTGGDTSPAAGLKASITAIRALPRALRLRGLGGQIVLDLAPVPKKDRRQIEQALKAALRTDPVETSVAGWTPLGHLELQRHRARYPLAEALRRPETD